MARVMFDFLAQTPNVNIDRSRRNERCFVPDGIEQFVASKYPAAMRRKVLQQAEFANSGENIASANLDGHRRHINLEVAKSQNLDPRCHVSHSTEHGADTGDQFARAEGLRNVIVAAQLEALDAIRFGGLCRQKNDRSRRERRSLPDVPAQLESVCTG